MGAAIGDVLGPAVGVALSPLPVIAVILLLLSRSGLAKGLAFALVWAAVLAAVGAAVLAIGIDGGADGESEGSGVLRLVVGAAFLVLAVRQWQSRHDEAEPRWMAAIDGFGPVAAAGLAAALGIVNPKNLGLTVTAGTDIASAGLGGGEEALALTAFVVIGAVSVLAPVGAFLVLGDRATSGLEGAKRWLLANNATIMTVLFLVLGARVLGDGIADVA